MKPGELYYIARPMRMARGFGTGKVAWEPATVFRFCGENYGELPYSQYYTQAGKFYFADNAFPVGTICMILSDEIWQSHCDVLAEVFGGGGSQLKYFPVLIGQEIWFARDIFLQARDPAENGPPGREQGDYE